MGNAPTKGLQLKNRSHKKYVHWDQAVPPWPPGKPHLVPGSLNSEPNVVTIRWEPPPDDGGAPITGYLVEHRKTGTPNWVRATTDLVLQPELQLSGLEPGWRYQFRVTAENAADLLSDPGELSQPLIVARAYRPATMAPQFSLELRETVVIENEKAEFVVHFHGIPTPKVIWFKDSFEIFSNRRMRVSIDNDTSSLVIFQAAFTDEGEYKCTATNKAGHIISKAKLRLEAPPRIRIPRQYEDGLLFEKDEIIRLKVSVIGRPLPRVMWYHDGDAIPFGGRFEVTNTDRSSALRISEARRADRGEYQVRASSRLGEDIVSFLVTVTDRPMPPGKATVTSITGRNVTISWNEPDDDGGCKIGNYIVEYYRLGWNVWLKAATCRQLTTTLNELIEGSEYKFRVKAENPYGVSEPSVDSDIAFIPDPKRGLLDRPTRGTGSQGNVQMPSQVMPDKKKSERRSVDSLVVKDKPIKGLKKRKETIQSDKDISDRKKQRNEELKKLDERRNVMSTDFTSRKNKENIDKRNIDSSVEGMPEIVKRQRKKSLETESISVPKSKPAKINLESEKSVKASLHFSVSKRRGSSGERDSGVSEESYTESSKQSFTSPLMPREDDSLLHGSSELMLVLLPHSEESSQQVKDSNRTADTDIFGDAVPPPMSLSAPELGGGEPLVTSPLRNAVSSTELLHEQAMARFYQAVADEEAEKARQRQESMDRKSAEPASVAKTNRRRSSLEREDAVIEEASQKTPAKFLEPLYKQEQSWNQKKQKKVLERRSSLEGVPSIKRVSPQPDINIKSILKHKEPVTLPSEKEEAVFGNVRQKLMESTTPYSILRNKEEHHYDLPSEEDVEMDKELLSERLRQRRSSPSVESKSRSILRRKEEEKFHVPEYIELDDEERALIERIRQKMKNVSEEPSYVSQNVVVDTFDVAPYAEQEDVEPIINRFDQKKPASPSEIMQKSISHNKVSIDTPPPVPPRGKERIEKEVRKEPEIEVKVEVQQQEEDYFANEDIEGDELEEVISEFDEEEELYKSIEEEEETYHPRSAGTRHIINFAEAEEEEEQMYHPRIMIPKVPIEDAHLMRSTERQLTPRPNGLPLILSKPILTYDTSFQHQLESMVERTHEPYNRDLERSPPKSFREDLPKDVLSSLILERTSHSPSPLPEPRFETPQPDESQQVPLQEGPSQLQKGEMLKFPSKSLSQEDYSDLSETESFTSVAEISTPEPITSISQSPLPSPETLQKGPTFSTTPEPLRMKEPNISQDNSQVPAVSPTSHSKPEIRPAKELPTLPVELPVPEESDTPLSPSEEARIKRIQLRKLSVEEDNEGSRAVADLYGDIIRDHARTRKAPKRYMTTAEMKAAAYASRRTASLPTPMPEPPPTPEPEPDLEILPLETSPEQREILEQQSAYDRYTAPVVRATTPVRKSRTPDLVLIRQSSRDRSHTRLPSTERFSAELSKKFPEVIRRFSPERTIAKEPKQTKDTEDKPESPRPITPRLQLPVIPPELLEDPELLEADRKWRNILGYLGDLAMFLVACWLYAFKDERLAIPILILMIYRQMHQYIKRKLSKLPKFPQLPWKKSE